MDGNPISKKEAQAALTAARTKAQRASEALQSPDSQLDRDVAEVHYRRCIDDFEEALNTYNDLYGIGDD